MLSYVVASLNSCQSVARKQSCNVAPASQGYTVMGFCTGLLTLTTGRYAGTSMIETVDVPSVPIDLIQCVVSLGFYGNVLVELQQNVGEVYIIKVSSNSVKKTVFVLECHHTAP